MLNEHCSCGSPFYSLIGYKEMDGSPFSSKKFIVHGSPGYTWQFFAFLISREKERKITNFSRKCEKIAIKLKSDISTLVNYKKLGPYHTYANNLS